MSMRPLPTVALSRRTKILLGVVAVLVVLIVIALKLTGVVVDWLWFGSVGYRGVFSTVLWTRVVLFVIFGVLMALLIAGNVVLAYRIRPPFRPMSPEQQNLEHYRLMLEPRRWLVFAAIAVVTFLAAGMSAQGDWEAWQLWLKGGSFGVSDPQFHRDISFYAWDYPVYRLLLGFGFAAVIFSLLLSIGLHYLTGAIRLQTPGPKVMPAARRHLTILVFVFMALKAVAYWLDRYGLVFSDRSTFTGASYTDVHSVLPARTILFWIAVVLALAVLASLWLRSAILPGIGFVVLMVLSILIAGVYPAIVQQVSVKPNASTKEVPYILRNIDATRQAYGIVTDKNVTYVPYTASSTPPVSALSPDNPTLANVRILDPNVISPTFARFQQDGNVYGFAPKLNIDRYTVDGVTHDYVVAVRELDKDNLTGDQTNWINQHTNYTHGYGFVAAEADKDVTNSGDAPGAFAAGGIPPAGVLKPTVPQVYFGELLPDYSIVGATGVKQEFDGNGTEKISYQGSGGVSLSSIFSRLAFAIQYKQGNFLLNDAASAAGAKIIFNRDPRTMVEKVAPFLTVDSDPYPVIDQQSGHIVWMVDGYTTLNNYPYSERQSLSSLTSDSLSEDKKTASQPNDSINYIRNSVKATVDAYTGKVTLYRWDSSDPVLSAWMKIFPGLVQPKTSMPADLVDHVRYPEDLFEIQRETLGMYHINDAVTFYNVGDKWTVPDDPTSSSGASQPPYYVLAAPPDGDQTKAQFQLTSPMNVNNRAYLAAFISVDSDPADYGAITVLQLPRGSSAVQGPEQVFGKIASNATITKDLSLFNSAGGNSNTIHGNLLTLPVGNSFLYIEPLYTQSTGGGGSSGSYPQLQRIIAVYGSQVGYGQTLANALSDFLPGHCTGETLAGVTCGEGETSSGPGGGGGATTSTSPTAPHSSPSQKPSSTPTTSVPGGSQQQLLAQLDTAFDALLAANRSGDFAAIGTAQAKVNQLVQQYLQAYGALPSASPTP